MRTRATAVLAVAAMLAMAGCGDLASIGDELDKAIAREGSVEITLPAEDETYRINASSSTGKVDSTVSTDPESERVIEAVAEHGSVSIQEGDDHA